jgi:hypothetical protein
MTSSRQRRSIALSLLLAIPLSGCITTLGMMRIGTRVERVQSFQRALRKDDQLVIDYQVILLQESLFGAPQVITRDAHRWSALDLRAIDWQSLERYRVPETIAEDGAEAKIELGPRPDTPVPPFEEIPILPDPHGDYWQELRDAARSNPLAVCCSGPPANPLDILGRYELVVLARSGEATGPLRIATVQIPELRYGTWWAIPTRTLVLPLTLAADVLTFPAQVVILIGLRRMD